MKPATPTTTDQETIEHLPAELEKANRRIERTKTEIADLRDRLDDCDCDEEEDYGDEYLQVDDDQRHKVNTLLELSAAHLCAADRAHCELWIDLDFAPTRAQIEELERIYSACEREANLRGEGWG